MSLTITNPPRAEENPLAIRCISPVGAPYDSETFRLPGTYVRVSVKTAADWNLIRMMQHGSDYHAPASGDGLLVKANLLNS